MIDDCKHTYSANTDTVHAAFLGAQHEKVREMLEEE